MREILFRGKRKDNGQWVEGFLIIRKIWSQTVYVIRLEDNGFDNYVEHEVIPETVGQYTGLTDKNGKKMFEGDIVKTEKPLTQVSMIFVRNMNCDRTTDVQLNEFLTSHPKYRVDKISFVSRSGDTCFERLFVVFSVYDI